MWLFQAFNLSGSGWTPPRMTPRQQNTCRITSRPSSSTKISARSSPWSSSTPLRLRISLLEAAPSEWSVCSWSFKRFQLTQIWIFSTDILSSQASTMTASPTGHPPTHSAGTRWTSVPRGTLWVNWEGKVYCWNSTVDTQLLFSVVFSSNFYMSYLHTDLDAKLLS